MRTETYTELGKLALNGALALFIAAIIGVLLLIGFGIKFLEKGGQT